MLMSYDEIWDKAMRRHGPVALEDRLPMVKSKQELAALGDDRYLAAMTKRVFQSGFVWRVIEAKWPGFEEAFDGFDPVRVASVGEAGMSRLKQDTRIVRNGQKIKATLENAAFVLDVAEEYGSFAKFIADWPGDNIVGLWSVLKKRGARLGGDSGPRFLRGIGKDTFVLSGDVVGHLVELGVVDKKPTSKKALQTTQEAFNKWADQSGRPMAEVSVILSCGFGTVHNMEGEF